MAAQSWKCAWCRRDVKASFNHCGHCGSSWQDSLSAQAWPKSPRRRSRRPKNHNYTGEWYGQDQDADPEWKAPAKPQSPRVHQDKSSARAAPKGKKPAKQTTGPQLPPPEPEWDSQASAPATSGAVNDKAELLLQELATTLKKSDTPLDSEVQNILAKVSIKPVDPSKQMHSATSRLDNARKELQKAKDARKTLHRKWSLFLTEAVKRWEAHTAKFTQEDAELQSAIESATQAFQEARVVFETSKAAVTAHDMKVEEVHEISDDELLSDTVPTVAADMQNMLTTLSGIRDRQEEAQIESTSNKRPRTQEPLPKEEDGSFQSSALQPLVWGANRPKGGLPVPVY